MPDDLSIEAYKQKCQELSDQVEDVGLRAKLAEHEIDVLRLDITTTFAKFMRVRAENDDLRMEAEKRKVELALLTDTMTGMHAVIQEFIGLLDSMGSPLGKKLREMWKFDHKLDGG